MIYCIEKNQYTSTPTAESVYVARFDYQAMASYELSFSKGEQLEINNTLSGFWWQGKSLISDSKGYIPRSYVQSMLETLQLIQFVMEEKVSLPILQKIRNYSCRLSNDDTVSLFLKTIKDDPILLESLRQDKRQHEGKRKIVCKIIVTINIIMFSLLCFLLLCTCMYYFFINVHSLICVCACVHVCACIHLYVSVSIHLSVLASVCVCMHGYMNTLSTCIISIIID